MQKHWTRCAVSWLAMSHLWVRLPQLRSVCYCPEAAGKTFKCYYLVSSVIYDTAYTLLNLSYYLIKKRYSSIAFACPIMYSCWTKIDWTLKTSVHSCHSYLWPTVLAHYPPPMQLPWASRANYKVVLVAFQPRFKALQRDLLRIWAVNSCKSRFLTESILINWWIVCFLFSDYQIVGAFGELSCKLWSRCFA